MIIMNIYYEKLKFHSDELEKINKKYNYISFFRLLCILFFLVLGFFFFKTENNNYLYYALFFLAVFLFLIKIHSKIGNEKKIKETLISINKNEISYLKREKIPFENGIEYNDFNHPYAYDLDIFGEHSLFQNLNRTNTYIGKWNLAKRLQSVLPNNEILQNQEAVKELSQKLDWRQEFMAFAKMSDDNPLQFDTLVKWSKLNSEPISKETVIISYVSPALFVGLFLDYLVTSNDDFLYYASYLFIFNLGFVGRFLKRIKLETANSTNIDKIILQYSLLVQKIEIENFESEKCIALQQKLKTNNQLASDSLKQLSELFAKLDSIGNLVTTVLFNGIFLYHFHNLKAIISWKTKNATPLLQWLEVIGEMEMIHSLANLSFNNPDFVFPTLNTNREISFANLSHPLLNPKTRIGNDVSFQPESFMILTGSNMSGKSTFLRSLGINMVLSGIGAPVCASNANVHPLPVLVSMRLSDSLSDSESYFYAEIKRLKLIMDKLDDNPAFVLLDEILRGTNSDDKRNGTIEVVKKMINRKAIGVIATHDIEVCLTTNDYPNLLVNKCFEVEIIDNDLHFDYKLRDGICKNRSATFLMKKMEVI